MSRLSVCWIYTRREDFFAVVSKWCIIFKLSTFPHTANVLHKTDFKRRTKTPLYGVSRCRAVNVSSSRPSRAHGARAAAVRLRIVTGCAAGSSSRRAAAGSCPCRCCHRLRSSSGCHRLRGWIVTGCGSRPCCWIVQPLRSSSPAADRASRCARTMRCDILRAGPQLGRLQGLGASAELEIGTPPESDFVKPVTR